MDEIVSEKECKKILGLKIIKFFSGGTQSSKLIVLEDNKCCKVYSGENRTISYLNELDITSRVIHPSIIKTYDIVTRKDTQCIENFNHGLLMNYIDHNNAPDIFRFRLKSLLRALEAQRILWENGIIHNDWHVGNQIVNSTGFIYINLNADYGSSADLNDLPIVKDNFLLITTILGFKDNINYRRFVYNKGPRPTNYLPKIDVLEEDQELLYDLIIRLLDNKDDNYYYLQDVSSHPIFKRYKILPNMGSYEPPIYITKDFRYKNENHFASFSLRDDQNELKLIKNHKEIWENFLGDLFDFEGSINQYFIFESIDLYIRTLPFIVDENLFDLARLCVRIILECYSESSVESRIYEQFNVGKMRTLNELKFEDKIIKSCRGNLRRRNFYHLIHTSQDYHICMNLMFQKYDLYLRINANRFWEVIPYSDENKNDMKIDYDNIIFLMQEPLITDKLYFFTRLTIDELKEYINLFQINILSDMQFYLSQIARRLYCYQIANNEENILLTPAVEDLIHLTNNDPHLTYQISKEEFEQMNVSQKIYLAYRFKLNQKDPNLEIRLLRLLRIGFYLKF